MGAYGELGAYGDVHQGGRRASFGGDITGGLTAGFELPISLAFLSNDDILGSRHC